MTTDTTSLPRRRLLQAVAVGGAAMTLAGGAPAFAGGTDAASTRSPWMPARDLPFDADWRFFLGDAPQAQRSVWGRSTLALFVQRPVPPGFHEEQTAWGWPDLLESWTWPGGNPMPLTVHVYTMGDEVALLLDGTEVGRKPLTPADKRKVQLKVPYQPGTLTAVAYAGGKEIARKTLETVGAPAKLRLRAERRTIAGTSADLAYVFAEVLDARGRLVPDAAVPLTFAVTGRARLRAAGSANPYGIESFQDDRTRSFHGTALAILQPTARRGEAILRVSSPGLQGATQSILLG